MAFQGSLAELHLPDIIQLVSVSGKTGVFHLTDGDKKGQIYLKDGRIVHAELAQLSGEEAVYSLAIWKQGEFRFDATVEPSRHTIQKSNTSLLMEAARRMDEWRVLSKKIPSVDHIPEFVVPDNREGQINLNTMEWLLLSKIDGHRSLRAVASATKLDDFEAAKLLYGLVATGLIRLRDPSTGTAEAAVASSASAQSGVSPLAEGEAPSLLVQLSRVRDECVALLGSAGESVVQRHFQRARTEIEGGAGAEAMEAAVQQIARAAGVLKGSAVAEAVLQLTRKPR
jgi:hypothetical protein